MSTHTNKQRSVKRLWPGGIEAWTPVAAVVLSVPVAAVLLLPGAVGLSRVSPISLFISVFLGPLLVLAGTWIGWQLFGRLNDRRFRQALAVLLIVSGATLVL